MLPKPKKHLGQNFLVDQNIQKKIIACLELIKSDTVFEIGAGKGEITRQIAASAKKVLAVEIDKDLCTILEQNLQECPNVKIICQDILNLNLNLILSGTKAKVFGNIPYYISSPIIEHLFKYSDKIDSIFLTVQKEFAQRLVAKPGGKIYGSFSCFVQYYTQPSIEFIIKKGCFHPVPKVDSAFVKLDVRKAPAVKVKDEELLFKIIRTAFGQRRKMLRNSLKGLVPLEKMPQNLRPEELSLADFAKLTI